MEAQEATDKLKTVMKVVVYFKDVYEEYKQKSRERCPEKPWNFLNTVLYWRLNAFEKRCKHMMDLELTCLQVHTW